MKNRKNLSSSFASIWAALVFLILFLVAGYRELFSLSIFFFFLMCLAFVTSIWGKVSLKNVRVEMEASNSGDFPGGKIPVSFRLYNEKFLPLVWVRLLLEETVDCPVKLKNGFTKAFSWLYWHENLEWETWFETTHRGTYVIDHVVLESGDGFGLGVVKREVAFPNPSVFHVYPELITVKTEPFLNQVFEANAGTAGFYEDPTLLKGIRDYQMSDSFKKINWRMLARQQKMQTNVYETIQPRASFFMVDLQSYQKVDEQTTNIQNAVTVHSDELEKMLSVLGSLFVHLEDDGMNCGLLLPEQAVYTLDLKRFTDSQKRTAKELKIGKNKTGKMLLPDSIRTKKEELLSALSEIQYAGEHAFFDSGKLLSRKGSVGKIYLVSKSAASISCKHLMPVLEDLNVTLLCNEESENYYGLPVITIEQIAEGGSL